MMQMLKSYTILMGIIKIDLNRKIDINWDLKILFYDI